MPFLYRILADETALQRWRVDDHPLVVGRSETAEARVVCDDRMSRAHFTVFYRKGVFFIQDLNSSNGTWVNGRSITTCELSWNDHILAGRTAFSFEPGLETVIRTIESSPHAIGGLR